MLPVKGPLVIDDDGAAAREHAEGEPQDEGIEGAFGKSQRAAPTLQEQKGIQESQRVTETVPPEVDAERGGDDGIHEDTGYQDTRYPSGG
jgi:hypothetical protein